MLYLKYLYDCNICGGSFFFFSFIFLAYLVYAKATLMQSFKSWDDLKLKNQQSAQAWSLYIHFIYLLVLM